MNVIRYLTFEISRKCHLAAVHILCPIGHPERYKFSASQEEVSDEFIIEFWSWCRFQKDFRGVVLWHSYNEPGHSIDRIRELMRRIRLIDPSQGFQLTTSLPELENAQDFEIVKFSDYDGGKTLDNRIATMHGQGKPYSEMTRRGWCRRGLGWEVLIDNHGNWCLCCTDWRNEESFGSILDSDWDLLYSRWKAKAKTIRWRDAEEYEALPRMCRSCMDVNPSTPFQ